MLVGINGAQGTGKSTLAAYLQTALKLADNWNVAVLSIDDFYLTRLQRLKLGGEVHPLLATRGVPGTHDIGMLSNCIKRLMALSLKNAEVSPRFNKASDDRADSDAWPTVCGPIDLIILEGWCVGSFPQTNDVLQQPVNSLEKKQDSTGQWRLYVNTQLENRYAELFAQLDR